MSTLLCGLFQGNKQASAHLGYGSNGRSEKCFRLSLAQWVREPNQSHLKEHGNLQVPEQLKKCLAQQPLTSSIYSGGGQASFFHSRH